MVIRSAWPLRRRQWLLARQSTHGLHHLHLLQCCLNQFLRREMNRLDPIRELDLIPAQTLEKLGYHRKYLHLCRAVETFSGLWSTSDSSHHCLIGRAAAWTYLPTDCHDVHASRSILLPRHQSTLTSSVQGPNGSQNALYIASLVAPANGQRSWPISFHIVLSSLAEWCLHLPSTIPCL